MSEQVQSIERAAQILQVLSGGGKGLTEIAREVGLGKSTTHRILASLSTARMVRTDAKSRKYMLGLGLIELTSDWLNKSGIRVSALPYMQELRIKTGETVSLNIRDNDKRVAIERLDTPHELRFMIELGKSQPLHIGAGGKAILAFLEEAEINQLIELANYNSKEAKALTSQLEQIRAAGWAFSLGERVPGAGSISAPILNDGGYANASISILCLESRLQSGTIHEFGDLIREYAMKISYEMGWNGASLECMQAGNGTGGGGMTPGTCLR